MDHSQSILIKVRWEEEDFPLWIPAATIIRQVKLLISQSINSIPIPAERQDLYLESGALLSDDMSVQLCGITNGSVLTVVRKIAVTIQVAEDHIMPLFVNEDMTVSTLISCLALFYPVDTENKALQMRFEGNDVVLDDRCYLWAAGIVDGTSLSLVTL